MKIGIDRKKVEYAVEHIKREIELENLVKGEKMITPDQISKIFHISKMEANVVLKRLRKEGAIVNLRKRGTFVSGITSEEISRNTVGIILSDSASSSAQRVIRGIETVLSLNGFQIITKRSGNSQKKEEKLLKGLAGLNAAGYIIEPSRSQLLCKHIELYKKLEKLGKPYVFIRSTYPQLRDKPHVVVDDSQGGYLLTRHMIATVGDNIVGIFRADDSRGSERHRGYVMALQEAGIPYRPELVIWYHVEDGATKPTLELEKILNEQACDGIICYNDAMATNIMYYLFDNGYNVPEDIAVAGYGNTAVATAGELGLTTIAQPDELLGEMAAECIVEMIRGEQAPGSKIEKVLNPELVIRGSTVGT
mgnify:CR=1 FL=1